MGGRSGSGVVPPGVSFAAYTLAEETSAKYAARSLSAVAAPRTWPGSVSYTHLRAHETVLDLVCRLLLENKKNNKKTKNKKNKHKEQ